MEKNHTAKTPLNGSCVFSPKPLIKALQLEQEEALLNFRREGFQTKALGGSDRSLFLKIAFGDRTEKASE